MNQNIASQTQRFSKSEFLDLDIEHSELRLIHMWLAIESKAKVVYKEQSFVIHSYLSELSSLKEHQWRIISHQNASVLHVATTYVFKILQLYEYEENEYGYEANCE